MTAAEFEKWLREAPKGSNVVYYTGHLCYDRESIIATERNGKTVLSHVMHEPMHSLGEAAYHAYEQGKVMLFQRRVDAYKVEYIAIKRSRPYRRYK